MTPDLVLLGLTWFVVFLFSTTLHEAGHALAAYRLGDPTAYHGGQVSLSPFPHLRREPFGMLLVPLLSFVLSRGGWMMGWASAPYDPLWAHRHPRRAALMALAGPAANLVLVVLAGGLVRLGMALGAYRLPDAVSFTAVTQAAGDGLAAAAVLPLSIFFTLNLVLFIFNLLPLPPLDGSAAIAILMPDELARRYQEFLHNPSFAFLGILIAWRLFDRVFGPVYGVALRLLYVGAG
ncbi:MAG TPA: site-2 protease family protein [Thermoanaerobaculia bacterium]|nr:site-2 protease family protein [Thermoanaerobaculia bacterium]